MEESWERGDRDRQKNGRKIYEYTKLNDKTIYLDSKWTLKLCKDLDENGKEYIRPNGDNGHRFEWTDENGKKHFYTSDLYLIDENVYLEPHWYGLNELYPQNNGTKKEWNNKIKRVQKQNNIRIIVLDSKKKCNWGYIEEIL